MFVDCHVPVVPGLRSLATWGPSAGDSEVLFWEVDGSRDLDSMNFGLDDKLVGDLLHSGEFITIKGNSEATCFFSISKFLFSLVNRSLA